MAFSRQEKRIKTNAAKRRGRNFLFVACLSVILLVMLLVISLSLKKTADANAARLARLESQIEEQEVRKEELEKQSIYMQSIDFIEKIARERLGLVGSSETVIKPEN